MTPLSPGPVRTAAALAAILVLVCLAGPVEAQRRAIGGPFATVGARVGFDTRFNRPIAGLAFRGALPRVPRLGFQAAGDFTFLQELTEAQISLDALLDLGGLAVGGGPVFRNTIWDVDETGAPGGDRETRLGYSAAVILGGRPMPRARYTTQIELRFVWAEDFRPRPVVIGVGLVL